MIAPDGSWVSSLRVSAERSTISRQRPVYVDCASQSRQNRAVRVEQRVGVVAVAGVRLLVAVEHLEDEEHTRRHRTGSNSAETVPSSTSRSVEAVSPSRTPSPSISTPPSTRVVTGSARP